MEEDEQDQEVPEAPSPVEEEGDGEEADNEQEVSGVSGLFRHLVHLVPDTHVSFQASLLNMLPGAHEYSGGGN